MAHCDADPSLVTVLCRPLRRAGSEGRGEGKGRGSHVSREGGPPFGVRWVVEGCMGLGTAVTGDDSVGEEAKMRELSLTVDEMPFNSSPHILTVLSYPVRRNLFLPNFSRIQRNFIESSLIESLLTARQQEDEGESGGEGEGVRGEEGRGWMIEGRARESERFNGGCVVDI
ncbi:hypothetical protein E2C01_035537 [Portunus trituberculatus]|uniref:Uncharacterized protein n=1 Tax=Portunus trituberculatus TaxID=210409 RepID=A0A5B7F9F2_PORTR|nr:hypothetical protein [Portunus trituberculatus]